MNENETIEQTLERVKTSGRAGASPDTRVITSEDQWPFGKVGRQGDVYLRRHPIQAQATLPLAGEKDDRQLAPGTTIGSRHIVEAGSARVFNRADATPLQGPIVVAPEGLLISHPKHADFDIQLPGCYEVTFPIDQEAAEREEVRRRRD